jgi:hypothetical protein
VAARLLAILLVAAALVAGGYFWGDDARDNAWKAKEAQRIQADKDAQEAEMRRGEKASGELQARLLDQAITNDKLEGAFNAYKRKHPILATAPVLPSAPGATIDPATRAAAQHAGDGGDPALSLGAVWMWNSALLGRDAPAGTCGLADTSEGACAADAGVSLQDAWDNQALNARTCADDRLRHQRLIDFLQGRKR